MVYTWCTYLMLYIFFICFVSGYCNVQHSSYKIKYCIYCSSGARGDSDHVQPSKRIVALYSLLYSTLYYPLLVILINTYYSLLKFRRSLCSPEAVCRSTSFNYIVVKILHLKIYLFKFKHI